MAHEPLVQRKDEMLRLRFQDCLTLQEIAEKFGITRERVRQVIGNTGYKVRGRSRRFIEREQFARDHKDLSAAKLAVVMGINKHTAARLLRTVR